MNVESFSFASLIYLIFTVGLYGFQIYQNYNLCIKFYKNIELINKQLSALRNYLQYSSHNMDCFISLNENLTHYNDFCNDLRYHNDVIKHLLNRMKSIQTFSPSISKVTEIGDLLQVFYMIHNDSQYDESLKYILFRCGPNLTGINQP